MAYTLETKFTNPQPESARTVGNSTISKRVDFCGPQKKSTSKAPPTPPSLGGRIAQDISKRPVTVQKKSSLQSKCTRYHSRFPTIPNGLSGIRNDPQAAGHRRVAFPTVLATPRCRAIVVQGRTLYRHRAKQQPRAQNIWKKVVSSNQTYFLPHGRQDGKRYTVKTQNNHLQRLNTFFRWCLREGYAQDNPVLSYWKRLDQQQPRRRKRARPRRDFLMPPRYSDGALRSISTRRSEYSTAVANCGAAPTCATWPNWLVAPGCGKANCVTSTRNTSDSVISIQIGARCRSAVRSG